MQSDHERPPRHPSSVSAIESSRAPTLLAPAQSAADGEKALRFSRLSLWLLGLALVAGVIFAYQPAWNAGFIWDDDDYVTENPLLTAPDGLRRIWFSTDSPSQYFPLTYTTFRVERSLWGLNPAGYHWVNILLHAANALLVWRLLARLAVPAAWLAAALFALHPVNVESVAWITELKNVQSLFFFLLSLLAWIEFVEARRGWGAYALALIFYALALCSKTTACTLPAALVLIEWLKKRPITWSRVLQIVPFVVLGLAMGLITIWWERNQQGTDGQDFALGLLDRLLIATRAVWFYLGKLLWPTDLSFSYPLWKIDPADPLAYAGLIAGLGLIAAIVFVRRFVGRSVEVSTVFFVAMLSPLLGFIMLYTFRYSYVADHYQYVASIGPLALAAAGLHRLSGVVGIPGPILKTGLAGALVLTLGLLTWQQSRMYRDLETLWRTTIERNPSSYIAHNNLSAVVLEQGRADEALALADTALRLQPQGPDLALALVNRGNALLRLGQVDPAIAELRKALEIQPDYAHAHNNLGSALLEVGQNDEAAAAFRQALVFQPGHANAHYNLGVVLLGQGQLDEAIAHFQTSLELQPDAADAHNDLGMAFIFKNRLDEARVEIERALELQPEFAQAHNNLAFVLLRKRQAGAAAAHYESALKLQPENRQTLANLAWVRATWPEAAVRDGAAALALASRANELSGGDDPLVLRSLAAALAESGRSAEAVTTAERGLQLALAQSNGALVELLRTHLKVYRTGSPVRDAGP